MTVEAAVPGENSRDPHASQIRELDMTRKFNQRRPVVESHLLPPACREPLPDQLGTGSIWIDQRLYFFGGGATFSSYQSNLVEPSFASLPGMSEFSLSLTPE